MKISKRDDEAGHDLKSPVAHEQMKLPIKIRRTTRRECVFLLLIEIRITLVQISLWMHPNARLPVCLVAGTQEKM
jgi:hypothetical protein